MFYYIIGDIHGCFSKLQNIYAKIQNIIEDEDIIIFLGDYIDRGSDSYNVIEFLISISDKHNIVFLKGNHESMLPDALDNNLFLTEWIQNGVIQRVEFRDQFIKTTRSDLH